MNYRNPRFNAQGTIDCEIDHPEYGWIPFTATPDDVEECGRGLYHDILGSGGAAPHVGPTIEEIDLGLWREMATVSAFQIKALFLQAGYWDDVRAYLADADPVTQLAWDTAQEFQRLSLTILEIAEVLEISDEQLDDLFRFAATIKA